MKKIGKATTLWIESDPLSGGSHSQVEFAVEVGPFFGGPSKPSFGDEMQIGVECAGITFPAKKMDFHHNEVWRLNLPTAKQGLGQYESMILVFQKTQTPGRYCLCKVEPNSPLARGLRKKTREKGRLIKKKKSTGGFRLGGWF
jgi:hypothetical protein